VIRVCVDTPSVSCYLTWFAWAADLARSPLVQVAGVPEKLITLNHVRGSDPRLPTHTRSFLVSPRISGCAVIGPFKIGGAALCLLEVWLIYCTVIRGISRELGLSAGARFTSNRIRADRLFADADRLCDNEA